MPTHPNPYEKGLERNSANHVPLTPVSLVEWAADVYPDRLALVHGDIRRTWSELRDRSRRLASALARMDVGEGDTVAVMLPNVPAMVEAHYGVPMSRATLNCINVRLDAPTIAFVLAHSEARVLITDREFAGPMAEALRLLPAVQREQGVPERTPYLIDVDDPVYDGPGERLGELEYEDFIAGGDPAHACELVADEWEAIGLNYTSGTTGNPKGVVVHHRGAYLNAVNNVLAWGMPRHSVYLWTLPMFHCNGWCFTWTMAAVAGTHVCLRKVEAQTIFDLIRMHQVTHYCGAPIVHTTLINAPEAMKAGIDWTVKCMVAGAAPPAAMIEGMANMGFEVTHVYGLTETYGPAGFCAKHEDWAALPLADQVERNGRQGVRYQMEHGMTVMDPETMTEVPRDGETMGEVMFRGNIVMKGYLKNPKATAEAFAGGWFHSGDLGVLQADGYVKIKDRSKDIIISGGENISSLEVEDVLYRHPAVLAAAVVAKPDPKWG
ncbi:MAG: AMP-binding protein [Burkholderiales bacterium]|nr:MAG: AMP-binding protein [Burkholderiales bacterium]